MDRRQIVLVDPDTRETFKVLVKADEVERIENDQSYRRKVLNDIKKVREKSSLKEHRVNLVELKLMDASHQVHCLKVPAEKRIRALRDLNYATQLLHEHLTSLANASHSNSQHINAPEELLDEHQETIQEQSINSLMTNFSQNNNNSTIEPSTTENNDELQKLIEAYERDGEIEDGELNNKQTSRYNWSDAATLLLIHLYKQNETEYSTGKLTYKKFWKIVSDGMTSKGYNISINQCTSKMDSLKRAYKNVKDHNSQSGNDQKTFTYYEELDELFHKKPWIKPLSVAGSNMPLGNLDVNKSSPNLKRPKSALEALKATYLEESLEIKRSKRDDTENYRQKKLAVMQDLVNVLKK